MLRRREAQGLDDVEQQVGVLVVEIVIDRLLGLGVAGFARRAVHRQHFIHRQTNINHRLITDGALFLLELDLHPAMSRGFSELRQTLDSALKSVHRRVGGNFHLHSLAFFKLTRLNFFQHFDFANQFVGGKNSQSHGFKNNFGKFMAVFGFAVAAEFYFGNDGRAVCAGDVVADLPFEIMLLAERNFGRRNGQAEAIRSFFLHPNFARHVGERQTDAHSVGQRFDADKLVFRVGAKRVKRQANQGEENGGNLSHGR